MKLCSSLTWLRKFNSFSNGRELLNWVFYLNCWLLAFLEAVALVFFSGLFEGLHHGQGLCDGGCCCVSDRPVPVLDWCLQQAPEDRQGPAQAAAHHANRSSGGHPPGSPRRQRRCWLPGSHRSIFSAQAQLGATWLWRRYCVPFRGWHAYSPGAIFSNVQPTPSPLEPSQLFSVAQRGWYKGCQSQKQ